MSEIKAEPKKTESRKVGYGLPCIKCNTYYFADLDECPVCQSRQRAANAPVTAKPAEVRKVSSEAVKLPPTLTAAKPSPAPAPQVVRVEHPVIAGPLGDCWSIIMGRTAMQPPRAEVSAPDAHHRTVAAGEFKAQCVKILEEVNTTGETIVITRMGRPVAMIVPARDNSRTELTGS